MAINKDKRVIHIRIGNLSFPIEIPCEKEEAFRHVERLVNEELSRYQERYRGQSVEKYMAMVLIDIGMKFFYSERRNDTEPFIQAMEELSYELESALKNAE